MFLKKFLKRKNFLEKFKKFKKFFLELKKEKNEKDFFLIQKKLQLWIYDRSLAKSCRLWDHWLKRWSELFK